MLQAIHCESTRADSCVYVPASTRQTPPHQTANSSNKSLVYLGNNRLVQHNSVGSQLLLVGVDSTRLLGWVWCSAKGCRSVREESEVKKLRVVEVVGLRWWCIVTSCCHLDDGTETWAMLADDESSASYVKWNVRRSRAQHCFVSWWLFALFVIWSLTNAIRRELFTFFCFL